MKISQTYRLIPLLSAMVLTACSGGSTQPDLGPGGDTASIAGLWDISYDYLMGDPIIRVPNTLYWEISADGAAREIDYDGDEFGSGRNCYIIYEGKLTPVSENRYQYRRWVLNDEGGREIKDDIVWIVFSIDKLQFGFTDRDYIELFDPLTGVDTTFPECSE